MKTTDHSSNPASFRVLGPLLVATLLMSGCQTAGFDDGHTAFLGSLVSGSITGRLPSVLDVDGSTVGKVLVIIDDQGCAVNVSNPNVILRRSGVKKVRWEAFSELSGQPIDTRFCIVFDPFVGRNLCSSPGTGITPVVNIDNGPLDPDTDDVEFKYSVITENDCSTKPLDPLITVKD